MWEESLMQANSEPEGLPAPTAAIRWAECR
jgi:hypothetical protein